MPNQEIEELLNESGAPCVSIIVPTHRLSPDRIKDTGVVNNAVSQAKELLLKKYSKTDYDIDRIMHNVNTAVESIDYTRSKEGIGIFASPRITRMVKFPFPVIEKVKTDEAFDSRDLLYDNNVIINYCVLSISKKHIRLFTGKGEELQEIKNEDFPTTYEETYEYTRSSWGTSYGNTLKDCERDKSVVQELRLIDFLRAAELSIGNYINSSVPMIVSGGRKEIADYMQVTKHRKMIIGKVIGNYNFNGDLQLANLAWIQVQHHQQEQNKILISNLRELVGKEMLATGIREVWKAANEGKGLELIVEKDFECPAFIAIDGYDFRLETPADRKKYILADDAVERIIKTVREKRGKVVFADNGEMKDFNGIALRLRYNSNPI